MNEGVWAEERKKWRRDSLEEHARLSKLFRDDRFAFENERKRRIEELINSAGDDEVRRDRLRALQNSWDRKMKNAGSRHNRFVLAQSLFWDHVYEVWQRALRQLTPQD
jgi:hypothetical protein